MELASKHASAVYAAAHDRAWREGRSPGLLIGGSWRRCINEYDLDPACIGQDVLTHSELDSHRQQAAGLVDVARPEMLTLATEIAGSGYALLLTDADGFILCHHSEHNREPDFRAAGLWDGANWSEAHQGTNGIGTALIERRPLTVHCCDHFAARNTSLSCSAAPIHAQDGQLLGVLDASSVQCEDSRASQIHTMALVRMTAQTIEKRLFLDAWHGHQIMRFHSRPEFVNLVQDGIIALDDDGVILAIDAGAAIQLGFDDRTLPVGQVVASLFDPNSKLWLYRGPPGTLYPVHEIRRGRRYYACLHAPDKAYLRMPVTAPVTTPESGGNRLAALAGGDERVRECVDRAWRVVDRNIPIMIHGETGTGKEVFARALHEVSARAEKPFVAINCAALPESLIESELFGYASGAFTGAKRDGTNGLITHASGGTLFLDEIGDMPLTMQTRLLRVLEQREVTPLGTVESIAVDLNLISATHASLQTLVANGEFRADLFYRLNGIELTLPPVRQRTDVSDLLDHVLAAECEENAVVGIEPAALDALLAYEWPGNIREMRNVLRTAWALSGDGRIHLANLPAAVMAQAHGQGDGMIVTTPLADAERNTLCSQLDAYGWNVSACARGLGMSRNTLYRKLRRHGIQAGDYRKNILWERRCD